jgi:hypothetical protein
MKSQPFRKLREPAGTKINRATKQKERRYVKEALGINETLLSDFIRINIK